MSLFYSVYVPLIFMTFLGTNDDNRGNKFPLLKIGGSILWEGEMKDGYLFAFFKYAVEDVLEDFREENTIFLV